MRITVTRGKPGEVDLCEPPAPKNLGGSRALIAVIQNNLTALCDIFRRRFRAIPPKRAIVIDHKNIVPYSMMLSQRLDLAVNI